MEVLKTLLYIILTMAGVALIRQVFVFLNKKIDEVQTETELAEYDQLNSYIDAAQEIIQSVVLQVSQTYVDTLKAAGKFTPEAQKAAKDKAVQLAKVLITDHVRTAIITLHGDFDLWLDMMIEKWVKLNK